VSFELKLKPDTFTNFLVMLYVSDVLLYYIFHFGIFCKLLAYYNHNNI